MTSATFTISQILLDSPNSTSQPVIVYLTSVPYTTGGVTVTIPSQYAQYLEYTPLATGAVASVQTNATVPYSTNVAYSPIITATTDNSVTISVNQIDPSLTPIVQEAPNGLTVNVAIRHVANITM